MSRPSSRANLARSAPAIQMHSQNVPASTGRPARKNGSSAIPVARPVSSTVKVTTPTKNPDIRWMTASQVRPETTARSTAAGVGRRSSATTAPGASRPATSGLTGLTLGVRRRGTHPVVLPVPGEASPTPDPAACRMLPRGPAKKAEERPQRRPQPSEAPMKSPYALLHAGDDATGPPPKPVRAPVVERIAGWSARHRKTALFGWLLLVAGAVVIGNMLGTKNLNSYDPGQAGRAERVLARPGVVQPAAETVLIQARSGTRTVASDPEIRRAIRQVTAALGALPKVATGIESPLAPGGGKLISRDGRSALVTFNVAGNPDNADQTVVPAERAIAAIQAAHPGLRVAESGQASVDRATSNIISSDFRRAEVTSVPITLVLLLLVFGALIAAGIPLLLAGTSVATAISLLAIPSRWLPVGSTTSSVVLLVGMAVGIDYSLFYLRREREERAAGRGKDEAVRIAARTSGRAIVVSGLTVMISLAGLFLSGIDVFAGLAVGTIMVVGVAVLGSLTALPAALSLLGTRVDRGKIPFLGRRRTAARPSRVWHGLARQVVARPVLYG